jgi:hypothetical protein
VDFPQHRLEFRIEETLRIDLPGSGEDFKHQFEVRQQRVNVAFALPDYPPELRIEHEVPRQKR